MSSCGAPSHEPGRMVPPYTMRPGLFNRPTARVHDESGKETHILTQRRTSHKHSGHILVAPGDDHHSVQPVASSSGLHRVSDQVPGLEGIPHAARTHADAVTARNASGSQTPPSPNTCGTYAPDTDRAELIANDSSINQGLLDMAPEPEEVLVASGRDESNRSR